MQTREAAANALSGSTARTEKAGVDTFKQSHQWSTGGLSTKRPGRFLHPPAHDKVDIVHISYAYAPPEAGGDGAVDTPTHEGPRYNPFYVPSTPTFD